jgi:hypothetical protein
VLSEVEKHISEKIEPCGLFIVETMPIFGASPDGTTKNFVVEVKCPTSSKDFANYIKDGRIAEKYQAQLHLQMLAAKKEKGLFCVADPNFEYTKLVHLFWSKFNDELMVDVTSKAEMFWRAAILPKLMASSLVT